jgi:hypothetical protein
MIANVLVEGIAGTVPVAGDLFEAKAKGPAQHIN